MSSMRCSLTLIMLFGLLLPGASSAGALYEDLVALNLSLRDATGTVRSTTVLDAYRQRMDASSVSRSLDPAIWDDAFRSAAFILPYSSDPADAEWMVELHDRLDGVAKGSNWHTAAVYGALVRIRQLDRAAAFAAKNGFSPPRPPVTLHASSTDNAALQGQPRVIRMDTATRGTIEPASLREPTVLAVVHPLCNPSRRALAAIESDESLGWLKQHIQLVVPPEDYLPGAHLLAWNADHPQMPMRIMYLRSEWNSVDSLDTPTFYVMRGGKVVSSFSGWPDEAHVSALRKAFESVVQ